MSRKLAIKARCLDCCGFSYKDRENCTEVDCPLHPYRLGKCEKGESAKRTLSIKQFCTDCCLGDRQETINCGSENCPLHEYCAFTTQKIDG